MTVASATATFTTEGYTARVDERYITHYGTIAIDASTDTYATGGLTLSLAAVPGMVNAVPAEVRIWSEAGAATQYTYAYKPGTTIANGKILAYTGDAEVTAGAVPAGVSGDTIKFSATFKKG